MLRVHAKLQSLLAIRIERKQIREAVGTPMKHASAQVNRRINERLSCAALFRLHVIRVAGDGHVGIVAKSHIDIRSGLNAAGRKPSEIFPPELTERPAKPYYSNLTMTDSGLHTYAPLLLHLLIAFGLAGALTAVSVLVGWRRPSRAKQQAYECGMEPTGDAREPFSVKFYLVAMVFILFDVEAIFLYPWAVVFRTLGRYGFYEMMLYIAILLVGYFYLWKKGALDWHK